MKRHKHYEPIKADRIYDALEKELLPEKRFMDYVWFKCLCAFCGSEPAMAYSGRRSTKLSIEEYRDMDYNEND